MRATVRGLRRWLRYVAGVLVLTGVVAAIVFPQAALNALQLPLLAVFSTTRMVLAYVFSLVFAITYGHTAATNKKAAVVLLPVLDVLQSIPILGFFPAALVFFVATFHGHPIGIEFAVVFLMLVFRRTGSVDPAAFALTFLVFFFLYLGLELLLVERSLAGARRAAA